VATLMAVESPPDSPAALSVLSAVLAFIIAVAVSLFVGPMVIRILRRYVRESIKSDSDRLNELHASKKETPTMGGLLIVLAFLAGSIGAGIESPRVFWMTVLSAVALMTLGAADDWIKKTTSRKGLTARQKMAGQVIIGAIASVGICSFRQAMPFVGQNPIVVLLFLVWSTFVITATSNAVNLTDGLDGLASGCTVITATSLAFLILQFGDLTDQAAELRQSCSLLLALSGSCLGFLWFNRHPARVFMGDAGSLPIGGILAVTSLASGAEFLLAICGGVFVMETLSVMVQVFWYRRTRTRVLLCSPLHNHFVFKGTKERRIVRLFWLASLACCILGALVARTM
jgi:phospho-N-acetylmuramoyl-pentapeptide-transferase